MKHPAIPAIKRLKNTVEAARLALATAKAKAAEAEHKLIVAEETYNEAGGDKALTCLRPAVNEIKPTINYDTKLEPQPL